MIINNLSLCNLFVCDLKPIIHKCPFLLICMNITYFVKLLMFIHTVHGSFFPNAQGLVDTSIFSLNNLLRDIINYRLKLEKKRICITLDSYLISLNKNHCLETSTIRVFGEDLSPKTWIINLLEIVTVDIYFRLLFDDLDGRLRLTLGGRWCGCGALGQSAHQRNGGEGKDRLK